MNDDDKTKEELLEELRRIRLQISDLEMRESELNQLMGSSTTAPLESPHFFIYFTPDRVVACSPGLFLFHIPRDSFSQSDDSIDESNPDFSFMKDYVHPGFAAQRIAPPVRSDS